jgi:fibronectin type 3 domain-containing protein
MHRVHQYVPSGGPSKRAWPLARRGRLLLNAIVLALASFGFLPGADSAHARPLEAIAATFQVTATDSVFEDAAEIRWTGAAGFNVFFRITRDGLPLTIKAANDSLHRDLTAVPGQVYSYCVTLHEVAGGAPLASACDSGSRVIFRPTMVRASDGLFEGGVDLTWVDNSGIEADYRVLRRPAGNGAFALVSTLGPDATFYQDSSALPGLLYDYRVQAVDAAGRASQPGEDTGLRGHVAPPGSVMATDGQYADRVLVTWLDRSLKEAGYRVYRDDVLVASLASGATSWEDGAALGVPHAYCVRAIHFAAPDTVESVPACDVGVGGGSTLAPPTNVLASDATFDDRVRITWSDPGATEDAFAIYRDGQLIGSVDANVTSFEDLAGQPGLAYQYCVAATSDSGGVSLPVCDEGTRSIVLAATNVSATDGLHEDQVVITWESTSTTTVLFRIYRDGVPIQTVSGADRMRIDADVDAGTPHTYCVEALTAAEEASTLACDTGFRKIGAPGNVQATDDSWEDRVIVTWNDNSAIEEGFRVFRRLPGGDPPVQIAETGANEVSYTDGTAASGVDYEYSVLAFDPLGQSASGVDTGRRTLIAPTNFTVSDGTSEIFLSFDWTDNSSAEKGYRIYSGAVLKATLPRNATHARLTLTDGSYTVRAFDDFGESAAPPADNGFVQLQAPRELTASTGFADRVVLSWLDASVIETGYAIRRNGQNIGQVPANATAFVDANPLPVPATYSVVAFTSLLASDEVTAIGGITPATPSPLEARFLVETFGNSNPGTGDSYGYSVAISGNLAVVGAIGTNGEAGRVYLYERTDADADWAEAAQFNGPTTSWFGTSVATDGRRVVVGARLLAGAYVIQKSGGSWQMTQLPTPIDPGVLSNTFFGVDVAIDGDVLLVSAPGIDPGAGINLPRIYSYERSGSTWALQTWIEPYGMPSPETSGFGNSIDFEGSLLVTGLPTLGQAYLLQRVSPLNWGQAGFISPPEALPFGDLVDLEGDALAVAGSSRAFVYRNSGAGFALESMVVLDGTATSMALDENLLVCGFYQAHGDRGAANVIGRTDTGWHVQAYLRPEAAPAGAAMGISAALDGSTLLLGAPGSSRAYVSELLAPPQGVQASDGTFENRINVRWSDRTMGEAEFRVYRDGQFLASVPAGTNSYDDLEAAAGRSYEYCVTAFSDDQGETVRFCDFGARPPDGNITGRVVTLGGAGVPDVEVSLEPPANRALRFDGDAGQVRVGGVSLGEQFTAEFWMKPANNADGVPGGTFQTVFAYVGDDGRRFVVSYNYESRAFFLMADDTPGILGQPGLPPFPIGDERIDWHHYAIRWRNTDGRVDVYMDGFPWLSQTGIFTGYIPPADGELRIGSEPGFDDLSYASPFSGLLDEFRVWNSFDAPADIDARRNVKLTGSEANLLGSWPFDVGVGGVVDDQSPARHYGTLSPGVHWTVNSPPVGARVRTDLEGNYVLSNIRYGGGATFNVVPRLDNHEFEPGFKSITLAPASPVQNEVEFRDVTTYTVTGNVRYEGSNCFVGGVRILVDGEARGTTDASGNYSIAVEPGAHRIAAESDDHTFAPASVDVEVTASRSGLDFLDTTLRTLTGRVGGGCHLSIGTVRLKIFPENNCLDPIFVDAESLYSARLIPQKYFVQVEDVIGPPVELDRADILAFFRDLGVQRVDLTTGDVALDFIYRAPLRIEVTGFPDAPGCGTFTDPERGVTMPAVPVIAQAESYSLGIRVFEDYGAAGACPVDSGTVTIFDEIIDEEDNPVVLTIRNGVALMEDGRPYVTAGNNPNIFAGRRDAEGNDRSYQKPITFVAQVVGAQATRTDWALVTGYRTRSATFTSVSQEIPIMILRDPPGDASSAFIEKGETQCTTISNAGLQGLSLGNSAEVFLGFDIIKGQFVFTKSSAKVGVGRKLELSFEATQSKSVTLCATALERISTSDSDQFTGADGDVYMGVAMNLVFAKTDNLGLDGCQITRSQGVAMGGDGFESSYLYTQNHIEVSLIPQLEELAALTPGTKEGILFGRAAENWRRQIALNDSLKTAAQFRLNRSFSAGASYEYSEESSRSATTDWSVTVSTSTELAAGFKWENDVTSGEFLFTAELNFEYTRAESEERSSVRTTGYTLADDDVFDYFSVDILEDRVYGTTVFRTVSGRSSCPWEFNTQPRDSAVVTIEPPVQLDVDPDGVAEFVLTLTNASPADETREYFLMPVQTSNSGGASIFAGGDTFIQLPYYINPGESRSVVLTVARGPVQYLYEDLQLVLISTCEFDYWRATGYAQLADTVTFTVQFRAPCSDITLFEPLPGWTYNESEAADTANLLRLTLDDFQLRISETDSLEAVGAEYRPVGTEFWLPIQSVNREDLPLTPEGEPKSLEILWDVAGVPDGEYELRGFTRCAGGRAFSGVATGRIDRLAPRPFGNPQPADSLLAFGEDIAMTFNEEVLCFTTPGDRVELVVLEEDGGETPVGFDLSCNDRTFILTPAAAELDLLEGRTLVARVRGVKDLAGNDMLARNDGSTEEWRFLVRRSAFTWSQIRVNHEAPYRSPGSLFAELVNGRGDDVDFELRDVPAWLTAIPGDGFLPAGGSTDIRFVIRPDIALGVHTARLLAIIPGPGGTPLAVSPLDIRLDVVCRPPTFDLDPAAYQFSMNITAQVSIGNQLTSDPNDVLAAFVGNELRGVAHPEFDAGLNALRVYLTVFGNRASGENIRFRYWDASECRLYGASNQSVPFVSDGRVGFPSPLVIVPADTPADSVQAIQVTAGWNWISLNLLSTADMGVNSVLADLNPTPGDLIKDRDTFSQFAVESGWTGSLTTLTNASGYKLKISEAGTLLHTGQPVPSNTPIPVQTGWNLVSYLPSIALPTNTALATLKPQAGDVIKGQESFAQYSKVGNIGAWHGSLDVLSPGEAYMLYLTNATTTQGVLTYPNVAASGSLLAARAESDPAVAKTARSTGGDDVALGLSGVNVPAWNFDAAAFQHSMTVTAEVDIEGRSPSDDVLVGAFSGAELRGVARLQRVESLGRSLVFLLIGSNQADGEVLTLRIYDAATDRVLDVTETLPFAADAVRGTPAEPVVLHVPAPATDTGPRPLAFALGRSFPNPPIGMTTINYALPVESDVRIQVFDVAGRLVGTLLDERQEAGYQSLQFDASHYQAGIYFYRMQAGSFVSSNRFVVVR